MSEMSSPAMIQPSNPPKDPLIAALLSFFLLGGVGQLYLGQQQKGLILIAVYVLGACVGIGPVVSAILGAIDAYQIATKLKNGQAVGATEWFWQAS